MFCLLIDNFNPTKSLMRLYSYRIYNKNIGISFLLHITTNLASFIVINTSFLPERLGYYLGPVFRARCYPYILNQNNDRLDHCHKEIKQLWNNIVVFYQKCILCPNYHYILVFLVDLKENSIQNQQKIAWLFCNILKLFACLINFPAPSPARSPHLPYDIQLQSSTVFITAWRVSRSFSIVSFLSAVILRAFSVPGA